MKNQFPKTFVLVLIVFFSQSVFGQEKTDNSSAIPKAKLIHSSPYSGSEIESVNIDVLRNELDGKPGNRGYIVVYCGKICQYGEVEAHLRGIEMSLRGKGLKGSAFIVLQGGFKEKFEIEYWLVPANACSPVPDSTVDIKDVKFKGVYKRKVVAYDCC